MTIEERFWNRVKKTKKCWIWIGSTKGYGRRLHYGNIYGNGRNYIAHRFSYFIHYGKFNESLCVCHKCDNPKCVRPDHLFLGTRTENNKDKARKNRAARQPGELHGMHKLMQRQVNEIRKKSKKGMIQRRIAEEYGISYAQTCRIINGTRWKQDPS